MGFNSGFKGLISIFIFKANAEDRDGMWFRDAGKIMPDPKTNIFIIKISKL